MQAQNVNLPFQEPTHLPAPQNTLCFTIIIIMWIRIREIIVAYSHNQVKQIGLYCVGKFTVFELPVPPLTTVLHRLNLSDYKTLSAPCWGKYWYKLTREYFTEYN